MAVIVVNAVGVGRWVEASIDATHEALTPSRVAALFVYGAALNLVAFLLMT